MYLTAWIYGEDTALWVQGSPEATRCITSAKGVGQGDPLGPLRFALALQGPLQHTAEAHPGAHVLALHDDVSIFDTVSAQHSGRGAAFQSCRLWARHSPCEVRDICPCRERGSPGSTCIASAPLANRPHGGRLADWHGCLCEC
jgi:hypothetical protein